VIVSDIAMPGMTGLEVLRKLPAESLPSRVIFLTMHADAPLAAEALRAGASGFVVKHAAGEELLTAIHEALAGRTYLTPRLTKDVLELTKKTLTARQREVLGLIAKGRTMKEIAAELRLSARTVETHKYQMMEALRVSSTAELIRHAIEYGLTEPPRAGP